MKIENAAGAVGKKRKKQYKAAPKPSENK